MKGTEVIVLVVLVLAQPCAARAGAARIVEPESLRVPEPAAERLVRIKPPLGAEELKWRVETDRKLAKHISFEFVGTPFSEALAFIQQIGGVDLVLDPAALPNPPAVTLKVSDMPIGTSLKWICRVAGLEWKYRNRAIWVSRPEGAAARRLAQARAAGESRLNPLPAGGAQSPPQGARLRVRFANGNEIEVDGAMLERTPGLARDMLELAFDPARDGLLIYRLRTWPADLSLAELTPLLLKVAPTARTEYQEKFGLLMVQGRDPAALRRAAAVIRALGLNRREPAPAAAAPVPVGTVRGHVLAVNKDQDLVMLAVGTDDKVRMGMSFSVYRGSLHVGRVQVTNLWPDMSAARIIWGRIAESDRVSTRPPAPEIKKTRRPAPPAPGAVAK